MTKLDLRQAPLQRQGSFRQYRIAQAWPQVAAVVAVRPAPDQITAHCDDPSRAEEIEAVVTEWQDELWPEALTEALAGHRLAYLRARGK